mgnify:FL=1
MPLTTLATVPHRIGAELQGRDGTRAWLDLSEPRDRLTLWAVGCGIGGVRLLQAFAQGGQLGVGEEGKGGGHGSMAS